MARGDTLCGVDKACLTEYVIEGWNARRKTLDVQKCGGGKSLTEVGLREKQI